MTLLADLEQFVSDHRPHGPLTADATEPAWNGYLLTVACGCGVVFEQLDHASGCRAGSAPSRIAELRVIPLPSARGPQVIASGSLPGCSLDLL